MLKYIILLFIVIHVVAPKNDNAREVCEEVYKKNYDMRWVEWRKERGCRKHTQGREHAEHGWSHQQTKGMLLWLYSCTASSLADSVSPPFFPSQPTHHLPSPSPSLNICSSFFLEVTKISRVLWLGMKNNLNGTVLFWIC